MVYYLTFNIISYLLFDFKYMFCIFIKGTNSLHISFNCNSLKKLFEEVEENINVLHLWSCYLRP